MKSHRSIFAVAASVVVAVALAGCSGNGGAEQSGSASKDPYADSPLSKMFEGVFSYSSMSEEEIQADADRQNRRVQEIVAECMADQGFDYSPSNNMGSVVAFGPGDEFEDPIEYARQYGYGYFTYDVGDEEPGDGAEADPNQAKYDAMSESEKKAYEEALWGAALVTDYDEDADIEQMEWDWEKSGCYGKAQHQAYQVESKDGQAIAVYSDPQWKELTDQMNSIYEDIDADPRMKAANDKWKSCMADANFSKFDNQMAIYDYLQKQMESLWVENPDGAADIDTAKREELKKEEIEIAVADATCRRDNKIDEERVAVQKELEQKFIDEHKTELEAFLAALQAAQAGGDSK